MSLVESLEAMGTCRERASIVERTLWEQGSEERVVGLVGLVRMELVLTHLVVTHPVVTQFVLALLDL